MAQERSLRLGIDSTGAKAGAREVARSLDDIRRAANRTSDSVDEIEKEFRGLNRAADALQSVGRKMTMFVSLPLVGLAGFAVKAAADMDSLRLAMDAMTGSSAETAKQMERLKEVARAPGLGFREAVQGSVNLQAVGFAAEDAERAMKAFGNAIATTGGGKSELDRVLFQLTQMAATGKIVAQDLKPIIQTAPAVAKALTELFGTTSAEAIAKQVDSFDEFFNLLIPKLEEMPSVAGGARNSLDNLSDAAFRARAALGDRLLPAVLPLIEGFADMLEQMEALDPATMRTAISLGAAAVVIGPLVLGVSSLATAVGTLAIAFGAISPWVAAGSVLIVGLGVLAGLWTKNKLEALSAADAVDTYRKSLGDMNMAQLMAQRTALQGQRSSVAEQIGNLSGGRGNDTKLAALRQQGLALVSALAEIDRQMLRAGTLDPVVVTYVKPFVDAEAAAKKFARAIASINEDIRQMVAEYRIWMTETQRLASQVSAAEINHGAPTRGRDGAGRPGQVSQLLINADVEQGRIDAARIRALLDAAEDKGESLARTASDVARGVIDVADAFGELDDSTRRALSGIAGLIGAIDGFDSSASALSQLGSIVGIAGAVAQIGASLLGGSEEQRRNNELMRQNNEALQNLVRVMDGFGSRGDMLRGIGVIDDIQGSASTNAGLAKLLKNRSFLEGLADERGIDLFDGDKLIPGALQDLEDALRQATDRLFEFGNSLDQQRAQQDAYREIFDLTDPKDVLGSEYGLLNQFAPELLKQYGAANLNLESEAGRATFEAALREMFTDFSAGTLDKDLLGQFGSGQEFIDLLLQSDRALDAFAKGLNEATRATTDIPKAINLALYQQRYATGLNGPAAPSGPLDTGPSAPGTSPWLPHAPPTGPAIFQFEAGSIVTQAQSGEELLSELERAVRARVGSGGEVVLS